jgi:hypothetical protein
MKPYPIPMDMSTILNVHVSCVIISQWSAANSLLATSFCSLFGGDAGKWARTQGVKQDTSDEELWSTAASRYVWCRRVFSQKSKNSILEFLTWRNLTQLPGLTHVLWQILWCPLVQQICQRGAVLHHVLRPWLPWGVLHLWHVCLA